jgi:hypothetical protein
MNDRSVRAEYILERGGALALFIDDDELRRRINPKMGRDRFYAAVRAAEQRGFPKFTRYGVADIGRRCRSGSTQTMG